MKARYYFFVVGEFLCLVDRNLAGDRSVANDIARIIDEDLAPIIVRPFRLFYRDSCGRWDEAKLAYENGFARFDGFAPVEPKIASTFDTLTPAFFGNASDDDLLAMGYERPFKILNDGRIAAIQVINTWMVAIAADVHAYGHRDAYYYRNRDDARRALEAWNGQGEPAGWLRHPQSGRRREDGDPAREHFQP
ncbi:hypothetical protein [Caballeronia sp. GAFFF1]|uniref:hypothetical protein n=1 Tax=Caballeronia sp. GAFFF1 TaxID=2921779 RepID=UPI0020290401|nr:hypothetical protein [Caballeronia sp. GAFFF1]